MLSRLKNIQVHAWLSILLAISTLLALSLSSCARRTAAGGSATADSTVVRYEYYDDGAIKAELKETEKRYDLVVVDKVFGRKVTERKNYFPPTQISVNDSVTNVDTVLDYESTAKEKFVTDRINKQVEKKTAYFDGNQVVKEKTKEISKYRLGCRIIVCKNTKIWDDEGKIIVKENFNAFYWKRIRYIYDDDGGLMERRKIRYQLKPKFKNNP